MKLEEIQANLANHTSKEIELFSEYERFFDSSPLSVSSKLQNFAKYVRRQDLSRFLAKHELFKLQLDLPGSIIECGCFQGGGTLAFAQLSAIYEPYNHTRKIIGFDSFAGFPDVSEKDKNFHRNYEKGDLKVYEGIEEEITQAVDLYDKNRPLNHLPKIELVKGDALIEIPNFIKQNQHLIVSMLYLDFDIYEPTKLALEHIVPRMPKGAVLAFDELNAKVFPGETVALLETLGIRNVRLRKTMFDAYISYAIIE
ncbi:TylF/MycF/NovP-related O-methyltransferase [Segetibacter sp.]|jgi:hypothetical protein|uniref:TylF/MycF/NovP-related O-methyltransferase n=1 Tax=Segetibacter sp. TaxID=2231182 RepID=UPI00261C5C63|nr:TylF/MycF/NovP-related O-methyltransferase [Segetibacter sp.]MCW3079346.1 class SAM-dependent methyltransferase [Segetibacter sp.]